MSLPIKNHLVINKDSVTIDGVPILVEENSLVITGVDERDDFTKVMLTIIPSQITIGQLDNEPEHDQVIEEPEHPEDEEDTSSSGVVYIDVVPRYKMDEIVEKFNDLGIRVVK